MLGIMFSKSLNYMDKVSDYDLHSKLDIMYTHL